MNPEQSERLVCAAESIAASLQTLLRHMNFDDPNQLSTIDWIQSALTCQETDQGIGTSLRRLADRFAPEAEQD